MKLDNRIIDVEGGFGLKTYTSEIDVKRLGKLWGMFENPYKNSIGSIIREYSSNAWDAHAEIGVTDAIRIKFGKDDSGFYISFIDVGVGISPDRMENIFANPLASTKEESNEFLGAFGMGRLSGLSYQNSFYINTRFDGQEYQYIMSKGETNPTIDLIEQQITSERNGTEIKLYIKDENDLSKFLNEAYNQLYYFENVVFDFDQIKPLYTSYNSNTNYWISRDIYNSLETLKQDFTIIQGDNFKYRTGGNISELHLCIGNVKYPIDWQNLGINRIDIPLALDFNIGDLSIIYTREDIRYTEDNINKIKAKIDLLKEELIAKYNDSSNIEYDDYFDFVKEMESSYINLKLAKDTNYEFNLNLRNILSVEDINRLSTPQLKGFPYKFKDRSDIDHIIYILKSSNVLKYEIISYKLDRKFKTNGTINGHTKSTRWKGYWLDNVVTSYNNLNTILHTLTCLKKDIEKNNYSLFLKSKSRNYSVKKNKYIFEKLYPNVYPKDTFIFTDFKFNITTGFLKKYIKNINKVVDNKSAINILNYFLNKYKEIYNDIFVDYDAIKVDETWWKEKLKENKKEAVDYDRSLMAIDRIYYYYNDIIYDRKNFRLDLDDYVNKHHNLRIIIDKSSDDIKYVSNANDSNTILEDILIKTHKLAEQSLTKRNFEIHLTSNRNYKKILANRNENSNIFTVDEFRNNKMIQTKILGKVYTIAKISNEFSNLLQKLCSNKIIFTIFNDDLVKDYNEIVKAIQTYNNWTKVTQIEDFIKDCDNINDVTELYDKELISKFNKIIVLFTEHNIDLYDWSDKNIFLFLQNFKTPSTYYRFKELYIKPLNNLEEALLLCGYSQDKIDTLYKDHNNDEEGVIYEILNSYYTTIETKIILNKYKSKIINKQFKIESND